VLIEKPRLPIREIALFGLWPRFMKIWLYRLRGYRIGKGVSIGFGSVLAADKVEVGDHTSIGFLTIIRGTSIRLGSHVKIGSMTFIDTPHIDIGEGTKINEWVFVGGLQFADSRFVVGRNCQIMQMTYINPARSVTLGDDTGVGGHSLIFGHTSWQSQFEGYPVEFLPIEIGSSVSLAWRVFVLPGTRIGDGAVIGANSLVRGTIPSQCLAVGFPARVIGRPPEFPQVINDEKKIEMFRHIVEEMIEYFVGSGLMAKRDHNRYELMKPASTWWQRNSGPWTLQVAEGDVREVLRNFSPGSMQVLLSLLEIPPDVRTLLDKHKVMWIEVANKAQSPFSNDLGDEVSLFMKRYGVRTLRSSWTPVTPPESIGYGTSKSAL
jgi:acetyltransferase-like isoleucine patch superfamily enzyme